jgi:hypothetical protein
MTGFVPESPIFSSLIASFEIKSVRTNEPKPTSDYVEYSKPKKERKKDDPSIMGPYIEWVM